MSIEEKLLQEYNEREITTGKMYRLTNRVCDAEDKLLDKLNEEQKELFKKFNEAQDKLHLQSSNEALIYGFRYGVSLVNELRNINL